MVRNDWRWECSERGPATYAERRRKKKRKKEECDSRTKSRTTKKGVIHTSDEESSAILRAKLNFHPKARKISQH